MSRAFQPLLGCRDNPVLEELRLPIYGSPKYDGIRGLVKDGVLLSRRLKLIPSRVLQKRFGITDLNGVEGELIYGDPVAPDVMAMTSSAVKSADKDALAADVKLYVFDFFDCNPKIAYRERLRELGRLVRHLKRPDIVLVEQTELDSIDAIRQMEEGCVARGFEGLMLRSPDAPYKYGRSTMEEQYLLKWKRFEDGECKIVEVLEGESNQNELTRDERGYAKRSKKAEGMVPNGTLGRFVCSDERNFPGVTFHVGMGPGLTLAERARLWRIRKQLPDQMMKYRFQRVGTDVRPRFPRYVSIRPKFDQ